MEDTRTMLHAAMPALRSASSKLDSLSRCFPTPLVRNIFFATNAMKRAGLRCLRSENVEVEVRGESSKKPIGCQCFFKGKSHLIRLDSIPMNLFPSCLAFSLSGDYTDLFL